MLQSFKVTGAQFLSRTQFALTWDATVGTPYSVWYKSVLGSGSWTKLGGVTATNTSATFIDTAAGIGAGFYRISTP